MAQVRISNRKLNCKYHLTTAQGGFDYVSLAPNLIFTSGSADNAVRCVNISILEDTALEGNQTFTVALTTSDPDVMLGTGMYITITDNDGWF